MLSLVRAIVRDDAPEVAKLLAMSPFLAGECPRDKDGRGKTPRQCTEGNWIQELL